jgi:hypothetical protein
LVASVRFLAPPSKEEGVRGQCPFGQRRCARCTYPSGFLLAATAAGPSTDPTSRGEGGVADDRTDRTWRGSLTASRSVPSATPWGTRGTGRCRGCGARRASTSPLRVPVQVVLYQPEVHLPAVPDALLERCRAMVASAGACVYIDDTVWCERASAVTYSHQAVQCESGSCEPSGRYFQLTHSRMQEVCTLSNACIWAALASQRVDLQWSIYHLWDFG